MDRLSRQTRLGALPQMAAHVPRILLRYGHRRRRYRRFQGYHPRVHRQPPEIAELSRGRRCSIRGSEEREEFSTFYIDDTPVYAVPDLVYRKGGDVWTVVDWKSGKTQEEDSDQALVYALYVRELHGARGPDIDVRVERLASGGADEYAFTQDDLDDGIEAIRDSIVAMQTYLTDPVANSPVEKIGFPLRSDTSECKFCKFYDLDRYEISSTRPGPF